MATKVKEISSDRSALAALTKLRAKQGEIEALKIDAGIPELELEVAKLKEAVTNFMLEHDHERIDADGFHATLVRGTFDARYLATSDDLRELKEIPTDRKVIPLRNILKRKFKGQEFKEIWNRVTRRVVDVESLEEAVSEGLLSVDELAPCFVEREKKPYMRLYED